MQTSTPKKQSGAGTLTLRHKGGLVIEELRENEKILSKLSGSKMQGRYAFIKVGFGQQKTKGNWLFFKRK